MGLPIRYDYKYSNQSPGRKWEKAKCFSATAEIGSLGETTKVMVERSTVSGTSCTPSHRCIIIFMNTVRLERLEPSVTYAFHGSDPAH